MKYIAIYIRERILFNIFSVKIIILCELYYHRIGKTAVLNLWGGKYLKGERNEQKTKKILKDTKKIKNTPTNIQHIW